MTVAQNINLEAKMEWNNYPDTKPEPGKDVEYIDSNNHHGYAFLSQRCGEWRCVISGGGLMINVVKWRYCI